MRVLVTNDDGVEAPGLLALAEAIAKATSEVRERTAQTARYEAETRRKQLGLDKLRPWDSAVDPLNRPALKPFEQVEEMGDTDLEGELGDPFRFAHVACSLAGAAPGVLIMAG